MMKMGYFMSAPDSNERIVVHLNDVPWLVSLFSMLKMS